MASDRAKRTLAAFKRQGQTETVTYRPGRAVLANRSTRQATIDVLVDRLAPEIELQAGHPVFHVTALNDADCGIPSDPALSDRQSDKVDVAERIGGAPIPRGMPRFVSQDPDWVTLEVQ